MLAGVLAALIDDRPGLVARVAFTAVPVAVLAGTLALTLRRGALLATGALASRSRPPRWRLSPAWRAQWGAVAVLVRVRRRGPGVVGP